MSVKKVALEDRELWPDEVVCFSAWTDIRNPTQQQKVYVDGSKLEAENQTLRQLAIAFADCRNTDCSDCIRYDYEREECVLDDVMRDLGIEVS